MIDLLALVIGGYGFYIGYSKGIIQTLFTVIGVVLGFLAGLTLGPPATVVSAPSLSELRTCIDKATDQTTRLSGAWLRCAAHGQFGETWHSLAHALQSGQRKKIDQAAHHILSTGATSGVDAMTGLLKAWEMAIAQGS